MEPQAESWEGRKSEGAPGRVGRQESRGVPGKCRAGWGCTLPPASGAMKGICGLQGSL